MESMGGLKRSHSCIDLRAGNIGEEVTLMGWVLRRRDHGGVIFIDLRDRWGLTQVVFNPEVNSGWTGSDYGGSIIEGHIGFEHQGWYIQGGPAWVVPDGGDTDTGFTAKTGVSIPVSADLSLYGEVSIAVFDDVDNGYATKVGAKYVF